MIKIIHVADLHLGLEFSRFPLISDKLKKERLDALKLIVQKANSEGAHAIVIAGDLFDKLTVPQKIVSEAKQLLASFDGEVLIIPGNHDWYNSSADANKLWNYFIDAPGSNVHFLYQLQPFKCTLNNQEVVFYPCGCHQKHSNENRIGWVQHEKKQTETINIGIAHGNIAGYGLDEEGNYFSMTSQELKEAGLDLWLLGHIHAPYPTGESAGHEMFFFAGNHCSDSWKSDRPGGTWILEINERKQVAGKRLNHSGICFNDRSFNIKNLNDLQTVVAFLKGITASHLILRLTLDGSLTEEELQDAKSQIKTVTENFLYIEIIWNVSLKITSSAINTLYVKDSIPHTLLTELSEREEDALAMQLAFETIKTLSK